MKGGYFCAKLDDWLPCDKSIVVPDSGASGGVEGYFKDCPDLPAPTVIVPRLGNGTFKPPEPGSLINTSEWGEVPANQILFTVKEGCSHCIAMELAEELNGRVVGYIDFIDLYQIETAGKNEMDLRSAILRPNQLRT